MIIIEGPDRVGKSTVADVLRERLPGWAYRHHDVPPMKPFEYYGAFLATSRPNVIVDRAWISEQVYGPLFRPNTEGLSRNEQQALELMLMSVGGMTILMTDDPQRIEERWGPNEFHPAGYAAELVKRFDDEVKNSALMCHGPFTLPQLVQDDKPTAMLENIVAGAVWQGMKHRDVPLSSMGCGRINSRGGFILLTDKTLPVNNGYFQVPQTFFSTMQRARIKWSMGYYTAVSSFVNIDDFDSFVDMFAHSHHIVAVGPKAMEFVKKSRLPDDRISPLSSPTVYALQTVLEQWVTPEVNV